MSEKHECLNCRGSGKVVCSFCDGTGYINAVSMAIFNHPSAELQVCNHCDGTGEIKCSICDGTGEI